VPASKRPKSANLHRSRRRAVASHHSFRDVLPVTVVQALHDGFLSVIKKINPRYAHRAELWLKNVAEGFRYRTLLDSTEAATAWLIEELRAARLPDLRHDKSLPDDVRHVRMHWELAQVLEPIFRKVSSIETRTLQAAEAISRVTGKKVNPDTLPREKALHQFLHEYLGTTPVRLSVARRRVSRHVSSDLTRAVALLKMARKLTNDPSRKGRITKALTLLRRRAFPLVNRYKP